MNGSTMAKRTNVMYVHRQNLEIRLGDFLELNCDVIHV